MAAVKGEFPVVNSTAAPFLGNAHRSTSSVAKPRGWLIIGSAALAFLALIINISLLAWTASKFEVQDGTAIVYSGSLSKVKNIFTWSHLGINVLSTLLVAVSNSCMQRLCAPTRAEVDVGHQEGKWLDIGILGFRNFHFISSGRIWLWFALAISTIPLHLLYNSVLSQTITANDYVAVTVTSDFFSANAYWNKTRWEAAQDLYTQPGKIADLSPIKPLQETPSMLIRLENRDCVEVYARAIVSDFRTVFLVSNMTAQNDSIYDITAYETFNSDIRGSFEEFCIGQNDFGNICDVNIALAASDNWVREVEGPNGLINVQIEYCMAEPTDQVSSININTSLLAVVIVCNLIKLICFLIAIKLVTAKSLVTIGDAVISFLEDPDPTTKGCSTLSKHDVTSGRWKPGIFSSTDDPATPLPWAAKRHLWFRGASIRRWIICSVLVLTILIAGVLVLIFGMHSIAGDATYPGGYTIPWSTITGLGFGAISQDNQLGLQQSPSVGGAALIANLPQLAVTGLYFMYNGLFTCMLTTKEWTEFADRPRRLRVSDPVKGSRQTGTMYLQLPYQYSVPIMVASVAVHWLLSQSIFIAQVHIDGLDDFNFDDSTRTHTAVEWSPLPVISVLIVGAVMMFALWLLGFRRYNGKMPLVGSCSVAISAACRKREDDEDITAKEVMWGAVGTSEDGKRFAGFSNEIAEPLVQGEMYH